MQKKILIISISLLISFAVFSQENNISVADTAKVSNIHNSKDTKKKCGLIAKIRQHWLEFEMEFEEWREEWEQDYYIDEEYYYDIMY